MAPGNPTNFAMPGLSRRHGTPCTLCLQSAPHHPCAPEHSNTTGTVSGLRAQLGPGRVPLACVVKEANVLH